MKPASPEISTASGNGIMPEPVWTLSSCTTADGAGERLRMYRIKTATPMVPLMAAAIATDPDMPRARIVSSAATKQAVADPSVLTK